MIYVDHLFQGVERDSQAKRVGARNDHQWCHMWCDVGEEDKLHEMAAKIGMKREWFQPHRLASHYDLVPSKRVKALKLGAVERSFADWLREKKKATFDTIPVPLNSTRSLVEWFE